MSEHAYVTDGPEDTERVAARLAEALQSGDRLLLKGDLGGGKTTFVRGLVRGLEHPEPREVASPTFAIHHRYEGGRLPVDHLDLYRLEGVEDAMYWQGVLDPLQDEESVSVVEWPERLPSSPEGLALELRFVRGDSENRRCLHPTFVGDRGARLRSSWPSTSSSGSVSDSDPEVS